MKLLLLLSCFTVSIVIGQKKHFNLHGKVEGIKSGKIYLVPVTDEQKYYGSNFLFDSSKITNGKFRFIRNFNPNISAYNFVIKSELNNGMTGMILIEPKDQFVTIEKVNSYISPLISASKSQNELKLQYEPFFDTLIQKVFLLDKKENELEEINKIELGKKDIAEVDNMRKNIELMGDSLLYSYSSTHTNSFVTLWKLIEKLKNFGYKKQYSEIFSLFSNRLKFSVAGKSLQEDLLKFRVLTIGKKIPNIELLNIALQKHTLNDADLNNKYTLIDFWFSSCQPCIRQFPALNEIYKNYKNRGFQIIGISTDRKEEVNMWKKAIKKFAIEWPQYIDLQGKYSKSYGIDIFPTNFLIDSEGKIIQKNITPDDIKKFLDQSETGNK